MDYSNNFLKVVRVLDHLIEIDYETTFRLLGFPFESYANNTSIDYDFDSIVFLFINYIYKKYKNNNNQTIDILHKVFIIVETYKYSKEITNHPDTFSLMIQYKKEGYKSTKSFNKILEERMFPTELFKYITKYMGSAHTKFLKFNLNITQK